MNEGFGSVYTKMIFGKSLKNNFGSYCIVALLKNGEIIIKLLKAFNC